MRKGLLLLLGMFMMVSTVEAKNGEILPNRIRVNYSYDNSVNFIERGIEFFVFTNGEFDFNTHYNSYYSNYSGRRVNRNRGIRIERDYRGRIRRIGNVFINYDYRGNVTRIGSVFLRYYRGRLTNVGDLRVRYSRWGHPIFYGHVKDNYFYDNGIRFNLNLGRIYNYSDAYFYKRDFKRNYTKFREDSRYYYYKANPKSKYKVGKRDQIIKRRKPTSRIKKEKNIRKKSNYSYRKSTIKRKPNNVKKERTVKKSRRN